MAIASRLIWSATSADIGTLHASSAQAIRLTVICCPSHRQQQYLVRGVDHSSLAKRGYHRRRATYAWSAVAHSFNR